METTREARPRRGTRRRESGGGNRVEPARDQFDLLTAMLLGVAVGTAATLLVSAGSRGGAAALIGASGSRAKSARRWAGRRAKRGARWMSDRGDDLRDKLPSMDDVSGELKDYLSAARDTISDTVSDELRDFRKAVRRQRKRIGV